LVAGLSPLDQGQDPGPEVQGAAEATAEAAAGLVAETTETGIEDAILAETTADQASHQFGFLQMLVSGSQARLSAESCFASHSSMSCIKRSAVKRCLQLQKERWPLTAVMHMYACVVITLCL